MFKYKLTVFLLLLSSGACFSKDNIRNCKELSYEYSENYDSFNIRYEKYIESLKSYEWINPSYIRIKNDVWTSNVLDDKQLLGLGRLKSANSNSDIVCSFLYGELNKIIKLEDSYFKESLAYAADAQTQYNNLFRDGNSSVAKSFAYKYFKDLDFNKEAEYLHNIDEIRENTASSLKKEDFNE